MKIHFIFGQIIAFDTLPTNSIALDGACQGPKIDAATRRFSFDHHADCIRMVTLATCQQVALGLKMGLVVDEQTQIYVNDLDADTSLSVWLLQNPNRVNERLVRDLVEAIGATDAHGPLFPPHFMHAQLGPKWGSKDPQTMEMLSSFLQKMTDYADGKIEAPAKPVREPGKGFGWAPEKGWEALEAADGFATVYAKGYLAGFLYVDAADGTTLYTVGKRSDLVPLPIGPSHRDRNNDAASYLEATILGSLGLAELEANPQQSHKDNWGGASTIGGSPRITVERDGKKFQLASRLTPEQVLEICKKFG